MLSSTVRHVVNSRRIATAVEADLRRLIATAFPPGSRLPPERELAVRLRASRPTVREVVARMSHSGELVSRWGVGTFVTQTTRPLRLFLTGGSGILEDAERQGFEAALQAVATEVVTCPANIAEDLGIASDACVWRTSRVLSLDGRAVIQLTDFVPCALHGTAIELSGFGSGTETNLATHLNRVSGIAVVRFDATIRAISADALTARALSLPVGAPLVSSIRVGRAEDGTAVYRSEIHYVQGRVVLSVSGSVDPGLI